MKDSIGKFSQILLALLLMPVFYLPRYGLIDWSWAYALSGCLILIMFLSSLNFVLEEILIILMCLAVLVLSALQISLNGLGDVSSLYYPARAARSLVVLIFAKLVIDRFSSRLSATDLLMSLLLVGIPHFLAIFLQRMPYLGLNDIGALMNLQEVADPRGGWRSIGLSTGNDLAGVLVTLFGFLAVIILLMSQQSSWINKFFCWIILIAWVPALLVTSRTGQVTLLFGLLIMVFIIPRIQLVTLVKMANLYLVWLMPIFTSACVALYFYGGQNIKYAIHVTVEPLRRAMQGYGISTGSSDDMLKNHYRLPPFDWSVLTGDISRTFQEVGVMVSDVSYVQILNALGLIGLLGILICSLSLIVVALLNLRSSRDQSVKQTAAVVVISGVVIMIGSLKGPYLFSRQLFDFWLIATAMLSTVFLRSSQISAVGVRSHA